MTEMLWQGGLECSKTLSPSLVMIKRDLLKMIKTLLTNSVMIGGHLQHLSKRDFF